MSDKELAAQLRGLGTHATHVAAKRIDEQAAEIARLRAACDASEERERAIELRFWQTVDRDGLTGLPSDMWAALEQLAQDRAALATARRDAMEEVERHFRIAAAGTPLGYEDHQRGASVYNWLIYCATTIATIRGAAKEGEP